MANRPALKFSLLLAAGILAGWLAPLPPAIPFVTAALLFLAVLTTLIFFRSRHTLAAVLVPLTVVASGWLLITVDDRTIPADDPARFISGDTVSVSGTVSEIVGRSARSVRFQLDCSSIAPGAPDSSGEASAPLAGRILVMLSGRAADGPGTDLLTPGAQITVRGQLLGISPARNPGTVDWQAHYRLAGIRARMSVRSAGQLGPGVAAAEGFTGSFVNRFVIPVRRNLSGRLMSLLPEREARFLNGLILGERNEVPSDLKSDFITVGVMHLLAISGQQVVLVALLIAALLTVLRVPEKPRFFILSCALAYYVLLTGSSPSVTRAGIMSIVVLGAGIAQRRPDILNALGVAAAGILLWDPKQLFDPGFLLSFSAVLAIVLLYPLILLATPALTDRFAKVRILDLAWKGVAVSLAAGLGTAPIVAYYFGRVSLVGFVANILIVPLSSVALVFGMLTVGASFVWGWLASVYAEGAAASAWLTFRLVDFFAGFPYASVDFRISLAVLCAFFAMVALLLVSVSRKSWKPILVGALVVCNVAVYWSVLSPRDAGTMRITFLDVGQGDAAFVEFPGGKTMLIDAGPRTFSFDAGERTVIPFLRHRGVERIDYLIISHPHGDHLGGVPAILGAFPVGTVIEGGSSGQSSLYRRCIRIIDSLQLARRSLFAGDILAPELPVRAYVLGPEGGAGAESDDLNNRSVVLMLRYGRTSVLFPGDAEEASEESIVSRYGAFIDADILKAGHHGSKTSSTADFVGVVSPAWTVISAGEGNSFGHPSPVILGRLAGLGSLIHRTDLEGAAVFESDGTAWRRVDRSEWP